MPYGWAGEILRVDLTKETISKQPTKDYCLNFIGGKGINAKIIFDEVSAEAKPFDHENKIIFGAGPLTGTLAPGSSRVEVASKSPETGIYGFSGIGGFWGAELKFAGYDHLVFEGKAKKPTYLWIENDSVELRDASHLWGEGIFDTQEILWKELDDPDVKIFCIGPGGENLVVFASIGHELGDGAGRTGMGAVMGSKNLKAIAVKGTKPIKIARPEEFLDYCEKMHRAVKEHPWFDALSNWGFDMDTYHRLSIQALGNKECVTWDKQGSESWQQIPYLKKYKITQRACFGCPIGCMCLVDIPDVGSCLNSCQAFSELTWGLRNSDSKVMGEAWRLCENLGIDLLSTAHIIGTMMELYARGIITEKDTDSIPLEWGSRDTILSMINKIARREGFGDLLAEGTLKATKEIGKGAEYYAIHTKGLTHFSIDVRAIKGFALATAVGPRGDIVKCNPNSGEVYHIPYFIDALPEKYKKITLDRARKIIGTEKLPKFTDYEGKAAAVFWQLHEGVVADLVGICRWLTPWVNMPLTSEELSKLFSLCTGIDMDGRMMLKVAERVRNIERAFEVRQGITRDDDTLPERLFAEPLPDGAYKGEFMHHEKFERMKDEYYRLTGWGVTTGAPTAEKLEELGLEYIRDELKKSGKIIEKEKRGK